MSSGENGNGNGAREDPKKKREENEPKVRDEYGRYLPGKPGGPGRKKGRSIAAEIRAEAERAAEGLGCPAGDCDYEFSGFGDYIAHLAIVHGSRLHTIELCKFFPKPPAEVPASGDADRSDEETDALVDLARRVDAQLREVDRREAKLIAERGKDDKGE